MLENDGRIISNFVVQALRGEPITVYGDGSQTRSFCYIEDLLDGLELLMESADEVTGPVNLGNPDERAVIEIARLILEQTGSKSRIEHRPLPADDPKRRQPLIARAQSVLGWTPRIALAKGLRATIDYFSLKVLTPKPNVAQAANGVRRAARIPRPSLPRSRPAAEPCSVMLLDPDARVANASSGPVTVSSARTSAK